jgi:serine/threonine-protein kinase HipA
MKNYKKKYQLRLKNQSPVLHESTAPYGRKCLHCYKLLSAIDSPVHAACSKRFYGQLQMPALPYQLDNLQELATQILQSQMAVTGVQAKISLSLYRKQEKNPVKKLTIVGLYGDYILKPPSPHYHHLPELESVCMHMAEVCGIAVVPHSLIPLQDGSLCYITKRLDRTRKGKLLMEDMCQLSERQTEDKYKGSHEQIAKLIKKYSVTPLLDVTNFFEQVLFSFLTGNSDMHLKNFSLLEKEGVGLQLCPAYDLVPSNVVLPTDKEELALHLNGKKKRIKYNDFLEAYQNSGLNKRILDQTLELFVYAKPEILDVLHQSFVPRDYQEVFEKLIHQRYKQLGLS